MSHALKTMKFKQFQLDFMGINDRFVFNRSLIR